jgi:hypothetical protein
MSKNARLVLFFLGATVFNILLMVAFMILFYMIAMLAHTFIIVIVGFIASIVLTFLIYGKVIKWATVKLQLEKNIPQLFKKKR